VDDLLFMRDIETGNAYLCLEEIVLPRLVHQVCQRMQGRARRKSMTLRVVAPDRAGETIPAIQGDPWRLEQALSHLLDSAIRFAEPGSAVSIEVRARKEQIVLSLHSEGGKVPVEALPHARESLYQGRFDGNARQPLGDLRLSLSLVRTIAEMHGGDLTVENESGPGATITLALPQENKGRLLNQSMALTGDLADRFRTVIGVFPEPRAAWQVATPPA
jgi:signal transduction histidine kinase